MHEIDIETRTRTEFIDVSARVQEAVEADGIKDGLCTVYVPHTTAGVTINEGADPSVKRDILSELAKLAPARSDYHHAEGNSDAHIKSSLVGCEKTIPVQNGRLVLGRWQSVFFCEFDGPRRRRFYVSVLGA